MSDDEGEVNPAERAVGRVDEEFAAGRGNTASGGAVENEEHGDINPQGPGQLGHKIAAEAGEGDGPVDKAKRAFQEMDRDVSGEYEARQEGG